MICPACVAKDAHIRKLELALRDAVWPDRSTAALLRPALGIAPQQAALLSILYAARSHYVSSVDLQMSLPSFTMRTEDRSAHFPFVVVCQTRRRLGFDFIETNADRAGGTSFRLSAGARRRIEKILKEPA